VPDRGRGGDDPVVTDTDYDWRHGWVPLTMRAALQKTKGNREAAAQLLGEARERRRSTRREFVTPHPRHRAEHAERKRWARYSDDDLADELGAADDDADVERIVLELDRRDRRQARADRARDRARERRHAKRSAEERRRHEELDAAMDAGEDPEAAYSRIWGVPEERLRAAAAADDLRANGYSGKNFRELARHAHAAQVRELYLQAEEECRGHMLNAAGERAGVSAESLLSGPIARAKKYGSEELVSYMRHRGRLTLEDFTAGLLGGEAKFRTAGDDW
jgi:hypothetical protein